jgi:predicted transcriptional regulator
VTKLSIKSDQVTSAILRKITSSGEAGLTVSKLVSELRLGRSCIRKHLVALEDTGHICHVRRTRPAGGGAYLTYHPGSSQPAPVKREAPARRDWLVAAFFGPACLLDKEH